MIVDAFRAVGVTAHTRTVPTRRGMQELYWLVLATLPLQGFLTGLGEAVGEEAFRRLKRLVGRVREARASGTSAAEPLVLQDAETGLQVVLEADLPPEAYEALPALDLSEFERGPLRYDRQRREWHSVL